MVHLAPDKAMTGKGHHRPQGREVEVLWGGGFQNTQGGNRGKMGVSTRRTIKDTSTQSQHTKGGGVTKIYIQKKPDRKQRREGRPKKKKKRAQVLVGVPRDENGGGGAFICRGDNFNRTYGDGVWVQKKSYSRNKRVTEGGGHQEFQWSSLGRRSAAA